MLFALTVFVTPLLICLCAFWSRKFGIPASVGIIRGLRGLGVPVACGLVLLTIPLFLWAAYQNAALNTDLERAIRHEGRYMAAISNKPWPLHARPTETIKTVRP